MSQSVPEFDFDQLTVPQRLELIARLWDSIPDSEDLLPIPEWHRQELDRRLFEADANPDAGIPWETVLQRLRKAP
jgi:putative addiction module component (TIGR02574 family)